MVNISEYGIIIICSISFLSFIIISVSTSIKYKTTPPKKNSWRDQVIKADWWFQNFTLHTTVTMAKAGDPWSNMHAWLRWILICTHLLSSFSVQIWYIIHKHSVLYVYIHIFLHSTVPVPFCRWSGRIPLPLYRNTSVSCSTYWIRCYEPGLHTYHRSRCRYGEVSSHGWAHWVEVACAWCWPWCSKACLTSNGLNSVSWRFVGSLVSCISRIVEWHPKHCNWNFQT